MKKLKNIKYQPVLIALISFLVFVFVIMQYTEINNDKKEKDEKGKLLELLILKKSLLEKALYSRIYYTKGIAAFVSINPNITNQTFTRLAEELINKDSVINSMSLSKNCILGAIYPYAGHEAAIGLNLLEHPFRRKIVESTIRTRNTFIAGPVELVEGGVAFISYTPIFTRTENDTSKFWGVTDIVILKDRLFNEINLQPEGSKYKFALRGFDGTGKNGKCFWGDDKIFSQDPVIVDVLLPTGSWALAGEPINGWEPFVSKIEVITVLLYISALIISILIWLLSKAIIKIRAHEKELKALFGSMQDLIIEFDRAGRYVKIAPTNEKLLVNSPSFLIGKTLSEVFDREETEFFMNAITKCFSSKKMIPIDYPLLIDKTEYWFHARISYVSENSVLYVAHDNTAQMRAETELRKSEEKLKESNSTKDKLFSVIAHDLRGPFHPLINYSEILKEDVDELDKSEIKKFVSDINYVAKEVFSLLENLLEWSGMQTGRIKFNPENLSLFKKANEVIRNVKQNADLKNIEIENDVDKSVFVFADTQMLGSIIQNLLSNSVKFTNNGGKIILSAVTTENYVKVSIADSGVGISSEKIDSLFDADKTDSTKGTNNEKGTGLGLHICREFVEMHAGKISVESEPGKGSIFYFTLPNQKENL